MRTSDKPTNVALDGATATTMCPASHRIMRGTLMVVVWLLMAAILFCFLYTFWVQRS